MNRISAKLDKNTIEAERSLVVFINAGYPRIENTVEIILTCEKSGVDIIELGVPFPNSHTDGNIVKESHQVALDNGCDFSTSLRILGEVRRHSEIPVVLLVDFSHTVKSQGLRNTIQSAKDAGADGILMHGLPPLYYEDYLAIMNENSLHPILTMYPTTSPEKSMKIFDSAKGYVYLVSHYGRSGSSINFDDEKLVEYFNRSHRMSPVPVLAGFGVNDAEDLQTIYNNSQVDGCILGSALTKVIKQSILENEDVHKAISQYLLTLKHCRSVTANSINTR